MSFQYPVVLRVTGRRCLVIGEGDEAEEKARGLEKAGAEVVRRGAGCAGDLEGFFLVVAATRDVVLNARIAAEARQRGVLCNAVDDPKNCDFILPAIHRQGDLTVSVSTNGKSPVVAVKLRDRLAAEIGPEYGRLLYLMGELRPEVAERIPDFDKRRELWRRLADSGALDLLRAGLEAEARRRIRELLERHAA